MTDTHVDALFLSFQQAIAGRYSLERELGRGGMGIVYLAREVRLDRRVAIKLLPPELAKQDSLSDRFLREARTAARLSHPHIVPLHAVDECDGFVFFTMAYVDGETLAQRVASRGPLSPNHVTRMMREVSWALAYAHAQGIVHRDIKPANILLERGTDRAMVTDFGIASVVHGDGDMTTGELLGTPEYMSPEQIADGGIDGRSDLYSLGVVGFYALTGLLPFTAPTAQGVLAKHLDEPAPSLSVVTRGAPRALCQAIDRCLQKAPGQRFDSGEALADALVPSIERHEEVPPPIRVFFDRRRLGMYFLPTVVAYPPIVAVYFGIQSSGATPPKLISLAMFVAMAIGGPVGILLYRLRRLARIGYGAEDLVIGARAIFSRHREEFRFEFGDRESIRERIARRATIVGLVLTGVSGVAAIFGNLVAQPLAFLLGCVTIITAKRSNRWNRLRHGGNSLASRFWEGRFGRLLGRVASYGLGARVATVERATELAIAISAESLFASLPRDVRASLGDVPETLKGLESVASSVRKQVEQLESAISEARRSRSGLNSLDQQDALLTELRAAHAGAEARLAEVVTALETIRLDLLRLSAGAGTVDGVTRALEAARAFGDDADRMISAQREVEQMLARR